MKHACQSCGQKYAIPDSQVCGRRLKVRCTMCQHAMEVDGRGLPAGSHSTLPVPRPRADRAPLRVWYTAVAGRPQGPYTPQDILGLVEFGEVRARTWMWKEGMPAWERVSNAAALEWVLTAVTEREARVGSYAYRTPTALFEAVPPSVVTDGRAYFPDPTLHSGWSVLSPQARAYLEEVAAREHRHTARTRLAAATLQAVALLALTLAGVAGAWAASAL